MPASRKHQWHLRKWNTSAEIKTIGGNRKWWDNAAQQKPSSEQRVQKREMLYGLVDRMQRDKDLGVVFRSDDEEEKSKESPRHYQHTMSLCIQTRSICVCLFGGFSLRVCPSSSSYYSRLLGLYTTQNNTSVFRISIHIKEEEEEEDALLSKALPSKNIYSNFRFSL